MSKTLENLMAAFAGESQANRKYLAYAQAADKEGLSGVAKVFRAAAAAETIHAHTHLKNAGKIGDTAANLQDAIGGETYEFTKMYPEMIKEAERDNKNVVVRELPANPNVQYLYLTYKHNKGEVMLTLTNFENMKWVSDEAGPDDISSFGQSCRERSV